MNKTVYEHKELCRRPFGRKLLALILACVLLIGGVVGGTVAWLTDKSGDVTNVFTPSNIGVELTETTGLDNNGKKEFKMIPGWTIDKDPRVTVTANSEDCWLFIEVTESTNLKLDDYIAYAVNTSATTTTVDGVTHGGWTRGTDEGEGGNGIPTNIYFRKVAKSESDQVFAVLGAGTYSNTDDTSDVEYTWENDKVLTKPDVDMTAMEKVQDNNRPTLSFQAYAVQLFKTNNNNNELNTNDEFTVAEAWAQAASMKTGE